MDEDNVGRINNELEALCNAMENGELYPFGSREKTEKVFGELDSLYERHIELANNRFQVLNELPSFWRDKGINENIKGENDISNPDSLEENSKLVNNCTDKIMDKFTSLMDDITGFIQKNNIDSM